MAQIWIEEPNRGWSVKAIEGLPTAVESYFITPDPKDKESAASPGHNDLATRPPCIVQCQVAEKEIWALLVPPDRTAWVSGTPVYAGITILRHRDSIRLNGSGMVYFSTEKLVRVEAFPQLEEPVYCGRCKLPLAPDQQSVCCPRCSVWHCQDSELERCCWTYAEHCSVCDQPTALDAGYHWQPMEL